MKTESKIEVVSYSRNGAQICVKVTKDGKCISSATKHVMQYGNDIYVDRRGNSYALSGKTGRAYGMRFALEQPKYLDRKVSAAKRLGLVAGINGSVDKHGKRFYVPGAPIGSVAIAGKSASK